MWRTVNTNDREGNRGDQDRAAGGHQARRLICDDGACALARVRLKTARGRRVYAYLVWHQDGDRIEMYIGEATGRSRQSNLDHAWGTIATHALLTPEGRGRWRGQKHERD